MPDLFEWLPRRCCVGPSATGRQARHPTATLFDVSLMHKDIRLALAAARAADRDGAERDTAEHDSAEHGSGEPSASEVAEKVLEHTTDLGYEQRDNAAILDVLRADARA
jgi:hypothetical protein